MNVRIGLVGAGAIGERHAVALSRIEGAELAIVSSKSEEEAARFAKIHRISETASSFEQLLGRKDIDALILASPTQLHASQALRCLESGKHVLIEIPLADNKFDAQLLQECSTTAGPVSMVAHSSRYYPSNIYMRHQIETGKFAVQQMDVQTYFLRRSNLNAKGEPRVWTDNLLWHHAAHTIDLFSWQAGRIVDCQAMQGPINPNLGIAMDMSIQLKSEIGALCTLSLSFNNDGPLGSSVRYIGDSGTFVAKRLSLSDGYDRPIDLSSLGLPADGIEIQDQEFVNAIKEQRKPLTSVSSLMHCYEIIARIEKQLQTITK